MEATMNTHFFSDTSVMLGRSLRHVTRSMDTIITVTIMPIAFMLLFVYVFGGAIQAGTDNYVNYLLPGILLIAIASGISYTAFRLFNDLQSGIFERFHSMPIARSSVLWGHVLTSLVSNAISVVVIVLVALLMGFRSSAGVLAWLAVAGILATVHARADLDRGDRRIVGKIHGRGGRLLVPDHLPAVHQLGIRAHCLDAGPVRAFAENQPVTSIVNTIRACVESSRSATTSGSPSPGASASSSSPMRSPCGRTKSGDNAIQTDRPNGDVECKIVSFWHSLGRRFRNR